MIRRLDPYLIAGFLLSICLMMLFGVVYGSNSTSNMTVDCIRMFYSDTWNKGYVEDLAKFCSNGGN